MILLTQFLVLLKGNYFLFRDDLSGNRSGEYHLLIRGFYPDLGPYNLVVILYNTQVEERPSPQLEIRLTNQIKYWEINSMSLKSMITHSNLTDLAVKIKLVAG